MPISSFSCVAARCASAILRWVMSRAMPSTPTMLPLAPRSGILRASQCRTLPSGSCSASSISVGSPDAITRRSLSISC